MTCKRCRSASSGTPTANTHTHMHARTVSYRSLLVNWSNRCSLVGQNKGMQSATCDQDFEVACCRLAAADKLHDAIDHLDIQGARQPALHEPPMNQGLGAHDFVTPCRWVCHPPSLQSKPSMAMNSLSPFCFVVGFERLSEFVNEGHFSWWHMVILVRLDDWTCVMHVTAQQDGCQQG
jgi:hypothetical protein